MICIFLSLIFNSIYWAISYKWTIDEEVKSKFKWNINNLVTQQKKKSKKMVLKWTTRLFLKLLLICPHYCCKCILWWLLSDWLIFKFYRFTKHLFKWWVFVLVFNLLFWIYFVRQLIFPEFICFGFYFFIFAFERLRLWLIMFLFTFVIPVLLLHFIVKRLELLEKLILQVSSLERWQCPLRKLIFVLWNVISCIKQKDTSKVINMSDNSTNCLVDRSEG